MKSDKLLLLCLTFRVNDYTKNGLDKDLVDPDRGVNLEKKRINSGAADEVDPEIQTDFPLDGFECGISVLPRISFSQIWKYLIEDVEIKKKLATEKPISKGYNFYKSGHIRQMFTKRMKIIYLLKALFLRR